MLTGENYFCFVLFSCKFSGGVNQNALVRRLLYTVHPKVAESAASGDLL